ncbi:hypothetical protein [Phycicoccus jejuensis]|uniref:hypothetical protein n=1 Tax=Phycicoccus jejuensis TaxID=367299 RepID=UPI0004C448E6|nr:hypothetical protein [Phycicoccus jejuensis]
MMTAETIKYELEGRVLDLGESVGKRHVSVRWEPAPRIVRVGLMIEHYDWDNRMEAIRLLRSFERAHVDEFAVEYDIVPLEAVTNEAYAEA